MPEWRWGEHTGKRLFSAPTKNLASLTFLFTYSIHAQHICRKIVHLPDMSIYVILGTPGAFDFEAFSQATRGTLALLASLMELQSRYGSFSLISSQLTAAFSKSVTPSLRKALLLRSLSLHELSDWEQAPLKADLLQQRISWPCRGWFNQLHYKSARIISMEHWSWRTKPIAKARKRIKYSEPSEQRSSLWEAGQISWRKDWTCFYIHSLLKSSILWPTVQETPAPRVFLLPTMPRDDLLKNFDEVLRRWRVLRRRYQP